MNILQKLSSINYILRSPDVFSNKISIDFKVMRYKKRSNSIFTVLSPGSINLAFISLNNFDLSGLTYLISIIAPKSIFSFHALLYQKRTPTETLTLSLCRAKKPNKINYLFYCRQGWLYRRKIKHRFFLLFYYYSDNSPLKCSTVLRISILSL